MKVFLFLLMVLAPYASAANIYDLIFSLVRQNLLKYDVNIPEIGNETTTVQIENLNIYGLNASTLYTEYPASGFNLDNVTLIIPAADVVADRYRLDSIVIPGIEGLELSGEGPLELTLSGFRLYAKMEIKYKLSKLVVQKITGLSFTLEETEFSFGNLTSGEDCSCVSPVINSVLSKLAPTIINNLNNIIQEAIESSSGDCASGGLELICFLISTLLTNLKNSIVYDAHDLKDQAVDAFTLVRNFKFV